MIFDFELTAKTLGKALGNRFFIINEQITENITFPILKTVKIELLERVNGKVEKILTVQKEDRMPEYLKEDCIKEVETQFLQKLFEYVHTN